ncbi:hypothetical protein E2C01_053932 [Portunus trituberculatus]|uniref:Uncharacterized protein n=1 Tax=Portunus trituberculatus TaxID=210409 RepID=A0A5B7GQL7_PORTR|nr:hypothetical protein [Portunus trituberculatus]
MRLYWKRGSMIWVVLEDWKSILDCIGKNGWEVTLVVLETWKSIRLYWKSVSVPLKICNVLWILLKAW